MLRAFSSTTCGLLVAALAVSGCAQLGGGSRHEPFAIAVIPDTQNYVDYSHQKTEGFALDADALFIAQMRDVARRSRARGGEVVFVASVGDVWQHQTLPIDAGHRARGFEAIANPFFGSELAPTEKARSVEIPKAIEGYRIVAEARLPFGVAPGNHDYDAMWSAAGFPPNVKKDPRKLTLTPEDLGLLHIGGLDNFRSAFGADSEFFRGKDWYVSSFAGGANSAQVFEGGGYTFLHLAIQMQAPDDVLDWARGVMAEHPGVPTILTTHDYLDTHAERRANPIVDLERIDPDHHNSAEELWQKLIRPNDQVFLVLCGHHHGQSHRVDANAAGHQVLQVLADYQDRGQVGIAAGQPPSRMRGPVGIGDGWYRLMRFDLGAEPPRLEVRTWSSHYESGSRELASYVDWYKHRERPDLSDAAFHALSEYEILLEDFRERFGGPRSPD